MLPCPFCGKKVDLKDQDTLYPSGTICRMDKKLGMYTYHRFTELKEGDEICYSMNCPTPAGGCGAEISGDSKEEAIAAWNKRTKAPSSSD